MESILEIIGRIILSLILLLVLLPVIWLVSSPFILIGAACLPGSYGQNVNEGYNRVSGLWLDWGICLMP